jgi:hypothetical protein
VKRGVLIVTAALLCLALVVPATSSAGSGLRFFQTADNNIACGLVKARKKNKRKHFPRQPGSVRCDIKQKTWVAPPAPKWCDVDWGFGAFVGEKGTGRYVCAGDTVFAVKNPVLPVGGSVTLGPFTCAVSQPAGSPLTVRCTNARNGHGFEMSAATIVFF